MISKCGTNPAVIEAKFGREKKISNPKQMPITPIKVVMSASK